MKIHPSAVVDRDAHLEEDVEIGPFANIEGDTIIGRGCVIDARVTVKAGTTLGAENHVCEGTVLGGLGQHVKPNARAGRLVVGSKNMIRENVTMHRALSEHAVTTVGNSSLFMVGAHVGHDCRLGNELIVANNALLGGHVIVEDQAYISGGAAVHQFCRIGRLAMVGGHGRMVQDVAPFVMVDGQSGYVVGLNIVGLRRRGFTTDEVAELKSAYRVIFRSRLPWNQILSRLTEQYSEGPARGLADFLSQTTRGIVRERRVALAPTTLKIHPAETEEVEQKKLAG